MATDGPDQSKGDLPWENLDATPDDLIVANGEIANKDDSSASDEKTNQKNSSSNNEQATEKEQDASVESVQKAGYPKMFWAKWGALLSLGVVIAWSLEAMYQWFGNQVQLEIQETSTLPEESFSQLFNWYSLAGVMAMVTALLLLMLVKLCKKISKPTKQIHCQTVVHPNVEETMTALKEELEQLKERIKEVDIYRSKTTFTWEIKGVDALLTGGSKKKPQSEIFYCRGIPWFISARRFVEENVDYLSVYLHHNGLIDKDSWSVVATLYSSSGSICGGVTKTDRPIKNPGLPTRWGWSKFVSANELAPFIENDTIKIQVQLFTKSVK